MPKFLVILSLIATILVVSACKTPAPTPTFCPPVPVTMSGNNFDATQLLSQLRQESQPFAHFYANETAVLSNYTIHWFHNPDLSLGYAFTDVNNETHSANIDLGNMSADVDVPFIIAHELATVVIASEGYVTSLDYFQPQYGDIAFYLLEMLSVPLRDSILAQYGFDVDKQYAWYVSPIFSDACGDPHDRIKLLINACTYAESVLYWRDVLGNGTTPSDIESRFSKCFPKSLAKGKEILKIISDTEGTDTPAKERAVLQKIINNNQLQDDICIPSS